MLLAKGQFIRQTTIVDSIALSVYDVTIQVILYIRFIAVRNIADIYYMRVYNS
jgi:hypothetical protein